MNQLLFRARFVVRTLLISVVLIGTVGLSFAEAAIVTFPYGKSSDQKVRGVNVATYWSRDPSVTPAVRAQRIARDNDLWLMKDEGLGVVRFMVGWSGHAAIDPKTNLLTIDTQFLAQMEAEVQRIEDKGLHVILTFFDYEELMNPDDTIRRARTADFLNMWGQIAREFGGHSPSKLSYEIYNEPHIITPGQWNTIRIATIQRILTTGAKRGGSTQYNRTRKIVVGGQ